MHLPWMHIKKGTSLAFVKLFFSLIGISLGIGVWLLQAYQDHILKKDFYFYTLFLLMLFSFLLNCWSRMHTNNDRAPEHVDD